MPDFSGVPLRILVGTARAVLREALDPDGVPVPMHESHKWLDALYELANVGVSVATAKVEPATGNGSTQIEP
jgi:hypothetical protein